MFEVLNKFQNSAVMFDPMMLVLPGVLCAILGIIIWLAGTKFTRILAITFGFAGGAAGAFYLFPHHQAPAAISGAVVGGLAAMAIHRFITVIAGMEVLAIVGLAFFVSSHFNDRAVGVHYPEAETASTKLAMVQTAKQIQFHLEDVADRLFRLSMRLPLKIGPAVAIAAVVLMVLGLFLGRLMVAVGCSSLGTAMIFAGMISLLLYKGSAPLTYIYGRSSFFCAIFFGMVVAGAVSQALLCRPPKLKIIKEHEEMNKKKNKQGEHTWTVQRS